MTVPIAPLDIALYLAAGGALGAVYFLMLLWTVRLHAANAAASHIVPLYIGRLVLAIAAFWLVAQQGPLPLLLTLAGFLIARWVAQRRVTAG